MPSASHNGFIITKNSLRQRGHGGALDRVKCRIAWDITDFE